MNTMQFSTVNTKVSALKSQMLGDDEFNDILKLDTVREVYDYLLEKTDYVEVLWSLKDTRIHRGEVESALYKYNIYNMEKLMYYLNDDYKSFLKKYKVRYEVEDLKLVIEGVTGRSKLKNIENHILSSSKYTKIDFADLLKQTTLNKVLEKIKHTKYYRLLLPYAENIDEKFNFYIEMVLDRYYYNQLFIATKRLNSRDNKKSIELIRRNIDMLNLEWIYRGIKFYDMSKEEILNFILDHGYNYDYYQLKNLIYESDLKQLITILSKGEYGFLFNHEVDIDLYMERRIERYLYYKTLNLYKTSILSFGKVMAYIQLIEFEVKDLISIIESKRYRLPANETAYYLIRTMEVVD